MKRILTIAAVSAAAILGTAAPALAHEPPGDYTYYSSYATRAECWAAEEQGRLAGDFTTGQCLYPRFGGPGSWVDLWVYAP
ncbi:hypothetical protein Lfu02_56660 [Longispora fulva]|uniref:Secreted protein n=1 Tax=Longispora fulva TaxID=619741 RepID=A0A8J7KQF5_9ACTN|nr:hypothetical protein [Longispora fulva]MBG6137352.1 hypothetical protein [Longispora fulva]GIG61294.1 hypothetical protein Lfu02_56660 [Longispora fulva]